MAQVNQKTKESLDNILTTAGGGRAKRIDSEQQLLRSVMACLLWENSFYEDGESIANRITNGVEKVSPEFAAEVAILAREDFKLRHVPLLIVRQMAKLGYPNVEDTLYRIIQRPDELTEFLAIYWKNGKEPISAQVKKGLGKAFNKFNEYQFAKYINRDKDIKLRDVLFLSHAKPENEDKELLFKKIAENTLKTPDTWEVNLSGGKDKKETWERLLKENKLGALALLRNLRNMKNVNVDESLIKDAILNMNTSRVLPFRFITSARYAPKFESELEKAMLNCLSSMEQLPGKTILIVDTSGSMFGGRVSRKSELTRIDAAAALAILIRGICENPVIYATAGDDGTRIHQTKELPSRKGFALSDKIVNRSLFKEIGGGGIFLKQCMDYVYEIEKDADRIIVITDEQDCDSKSVRSLENARTFGKSNYLINVSVEKNGIGYKNWIHIDGFSESIIKYIQAFESQF